MRSPLRPDPAHPFQMVKFLSWSSVVLILCTTIFLSVVITNYAKRIVLRKHQEFAQLLAENLNHQIYQRFTLPTILGFGRIKLKEKAQYDRLDQVVKSTIHSFHVLELRIYDQQGVITYSLDPAQAGQKGTVGPAYRQALDFGRASFDLSTNTSFLKSWFGFQLPDGSYTLRTTYALRAERRLDPKVPGPIMGILEVSQDITHDYETIVTFQWSVLGVTLTSSVILFLFLFMIIRRADKIVAERIQEKQRLERELHQNERLASMGRMVASVAHEIRNPLGIIRSSAEILHKKAQTEQSPNQRLLGAIFDESMRLSRIVNDFLDYARPKQPHLAPVDLNRTLDNVFTFLEQELTQAKVVVQRDLAQDLIVSGDKDLIYRLFYNLVSNSLQAMAGPGTLTVEGRSEAGMAQVTVADTGPGFDTGLLDKYLEPFYTSKDTGTGLGLTIARNIVESHGGRIELGNGTSGGARITVTLPLAGLNGQP